MHKQEERAGALAAPPLRREAQLQLRCTAEQKERLERKAAANHESVSAFLIRAALTRIPPITNDQLLELGVRISRLGFELNDTVHRMNAYLDPNGVLWRDVLSIYSDIRRAVLDLFHWVDEAPPPKRFSPEQVMWGSMGERLHVRCTPRQKQRIVARAARRQLTITDYLLTAAAQRSEHLDRLTVTRVYYLIQKIGNNLTQAVKVMSETWSPEDGYADLYADYMDNVKGLFERALFSSDVLEEEGE